MPLEASRGIVASCLIQNDLWLWRWPWSLLWRFWRTTLHQRRIQLYIDRYSYYIRNCGSSSCCQGGDRFESWLNTMSLLLRHGVCFKVHGLESKWLQTPKRSILEILESSFPFLQVCMGDPRGPLFTREESSYTLIGIPILYLKIKTYNVVHLLFVTEVIGSNLCLTWCLRNKDAECVLRCMEMSRSWSDTKPDSWKQSLFPFPQSA